MGEIPRHIAITMGGNRLHARQKGLSVSSMYAHMFERINEVIRMQTDANIPIVTLYMLTSKVRESDDFAVIMDNLVEFFEGLTNNAHIFKNKIKVSIIGKWYDLPGRVVESIKKVIEETRDYDTFFLNVCINYDGRDEIVDACKIIARKIKAGKLDPEMINPDAIKDGIYSSYFMPPDIFIKTGPDRKLNGFLLWDTTQSHIFFSGKLWPEFERKDLLRAIKEWSDLRESAKKWEKK